MTVTVRHPAAGRHGNFAHRLSPYCQGHMIMLWAVMESLGGVLRVCAFYLLGHIVFAQTGHLQAGTAAGVFEKINHKHIERIESRHSESSESERTFSSSATVGQQYRNKRALKVWRLSRVLAHWEQYVL